MKLSRCSINFLFSAILASESTALLVDSLVASETNCVRPTTTSSIVCSRWPTSNAAFSVCSVTLFSWFTTMALNGPISLSPGTPMRLQALFDGQRGRVSSICSRKPK